MQTVKNIKTGKIGFIERWDFGSASPKIFVVFEDNIKDIWYEGDFEIMENKSDFESIAEEVGKLVTEKNKSYGNSFEDSEKFLKILYPNGIPVDNYGDMLCIVRIFDKLKRISTNKPLENENNLDAYKDIIGYGILGVRKINNGSK